MKLEFTLSGLCAVFLFSVLIYQEMPQDSLVFMKIPAILIASFFIVMFCCGFLFFLADVKISWVDKFFHDN